MNRREFVERLGACGVGAAALTLDIPRALYGQSSSPEPVRLQRQTFFAWEL